MLSGVVCPGVGQLYNREWAKGLLLILATLAALAAFVVKVIQAAFDRITADPSWADPLRVVELAQEIERANAGLFKGMMVALVALWVFAIVDAWRGASRRL